MKHKNPETKKDDEKKAKKKKKKAPLNKKRLNNKVLKAKEILAKNREAAKYGGKLPDVPKLPLWKRIFRIVRKTILWLLVAVLAALLVSFLLVRIQGGTPTVFGYSLQRISSGSMEPTLHVGDMVVSKEVKSPDEIKVDDIVTYQGGSDVDNRMITHRVVTAPYLNENDEWVLVTKGDANVVDDKEVRFSSVLSKYVSKFDLLNKLYSFFLSPGGLLIFIAVVILVFFDELLTIVKVLTGNYHEEEDEEDEEEKRLREFEEKERLREEELREKKRKNPRKFDNTSNKKKKNRKKQAKKSAGSKPKKKQSSRSKKKPSKKSAKK